MCQLFLAFVTLVVLHNVDGDEVTINPEHVATLIHTKESIGQKNVLVAKGVKCIIIMSGGNVVSVREDCGMIRQAIREAVK